MPGCDVGTLMTWRRSLNSIDGREPLKGFERGGYTGLAESPGGTVQYRVLGSPAGLGCDSSRSKTDALGPGLFMGATGNFGVCSEAKTLYHFHINTFHCLLSFHYSSIPSFHFVPKD